MHLGHKACPFGRCLWILHPPPTVHSMILSVAYIVGNLRSVIIFSTKGSAVVVVNCGTSHKCASTEGTRRNKKGCAQPKRELTADARRNGRKSPKQQPQCGVKWANAMRKADWRGTAIPRNLNDVMGYTPLGEVSRPISHS